MPEHQEATSYKFSQLYLRHVDTGGQTFCHTNEYQDLYLGATYTHHISRRKVNPIDLRLCKLHTKILLLRCVSRADLKQRVCALGVLEFLIKTWLPMILRGLLYFEQLHDEIQLSIPNFTNTCQLCPRAAKQARQAVEIPKTMSNNKTPAVPCPRPC